VDSGHFAGGGEADLEVALKKAYQLLVQALVQTAARESGGEVGPPGEAGGRDKRRFLFSCEAFFMLRVDVFIQALGWHRFWRGQKKSELSRLNLLSKGFVYRDG
jgi:hypothetical protein